MEIMKRIIALLAAAAAALPALCQENAPGTVTYSLPNTTVTLEVGVDTVCHLDYEPLPIPII